VEPIFGLLYLEYTSSNFSLKFLKPCLPKTKSASVRDVEGGVGDAMMDLPSASSLLLVLCLGPVFRLPNSQRPPRRSVLLVGFCLSPSGDQLSLGLILLRRIVVATIWKELGGWCWFYSSFWNSDLGYFGFGFVF